MSKEAMKLAQQPAPVQGWKLVPVKPTREMVDALADTDPEHDSVWDAVLAAAPQPAQQQEPLGYVTATEMQLFLASGRPALMCKRTINTERADVPVYVTPQPAQRTWVGLTDEEIEDVFNNWPTHHLDHEAFARAIEAKLMEKNT